MKEKEIIKTRLVKAIGQKSGKVYYNFIIEVLDDYDNTYFTFKNVFMGENEARSLRRFGIKFEELETIKVDDSKINVNE